MKVSAISDVHVKAPHDEAYKLLLSFLTHPEVKSSQYVVLLGDIFDFMVGTHKKYLADYKELFDAIGDLQKAGKKIYYTEGNHDVHLQKLLRYIWPNDEVLVTQSPVIETIDGKKYYFSHGDEHEVENHAYHKYMRFIRTKPLKFVAEYIMPYGVLNYIGKKASAKSRKRGYKSFDSEKVKNTFRSGVQIITEGKYDFVLGGHSHVQDQFEMKPGSLYINNGYALGTKTFILIDHHQVKFLPLNA